MFFSLPPRRCLPRGLIDVGNPLLSWWPAVSFEDVSLKHYTLIVIVLDTAPGRRRGQSRSEVRLGPGARTVLRRASHRPGGLVEICERSLMRSLSGPEVIGADLSAAPWERVTRRFEERRKSKPGERAHHQRAQRSKASGSLQPGAVSTGRDAVKTEEPLPPPNTPNSTSLTRLSFGEP